MVNRRSCDVRPVFYVYMTRRLPVFPIGLLTAPPAPPASPVRRTCSLAPRFTRISSILGTFSRAVLYAVLAACAPCCEGYFSASSDVPFPLTSDARRQLRQPISLPLLPTPLQPGVFAHARRVPPEEFSAYTGRPHFPLAWTLPLDHPNALGLDATLI